MSSTFCLVSENAAVNKSTTVQALLDHLSLLANVTYPQEIVTIDTANIVWRQLAAADVEYQDELHSSIEEFEYDELPVDSIRLIKLSGVQNGSVELQLETFSLFAAPPYDALSYRWETESELHKRKVTCNGRHFMLSPDLHAALHRIYLLQSLIDHGTEHVVYLWNDFTCINQRNIKEREVQVSKMADIYAGAQRAIVWLGSADRLSNLALLSIPGTIEQFSKYQVTMSNDDLKAAGLDDMALWKAYGEFFHKPWFERLWILQEAILAPRLTLICGEVAVDWLAVTDLLKVFAAAGLYRLASGEHGWDERKLKRNGLVTIKDINRLREARQGKDRIASVPHLMDVAWERPCLERVDYVWAVVGLMPDVMRQNIFAQNFVDYSENGRKHYEKTFIKTAKWLVELDPSGVLSMAARSEKSDEFPTWCPNWSIPPRCSNLGMSYSTAGILEVEQEIRNLKKDGHEQNENEPPLDDVTGAYTTWSWEHDVLGIAGYRVDAIVVLTDDVWSSSASTEVDLVSRTLEMLAWQA